MYPETPVTGTQHHKNNILSNSGRMIVLMVFITAVVWILPAQTGFFTTLAPQETTITISGLVKAGPENTPLPNATVYSDRELVMTDTNGLFKLAASCNADIRIEAAGYKSAEVTIKDRTPLMFLLSPVPMKQ